MHPRTSFSQRIALFAAFAAASLSGNSVYCSSAAAPVGKTVTFSVTADGTTPFTYQWKKGGIDIPGATGATYKIVGVQLSNAGNYTVAVTNSVGSATSDIAALTVSNPAAASDVNGDGMSDVLWENTTTGERYLWYMTGTTKASETTLGTAGLDWHIVGSGDFNADNKPDILWQNKSTGELYVWYLNGAVKTGEATLGA